MDRPTQPGTYRFHDAADLERQFQPATVEVVLDGDVLCARFSDDGDSELLPVEWLDGSWDGPIAAARP